MPPRLSTTSFGTAPDSLPPPGTAGHAAAILDLALAPHETLILPPDRLDAAGLARLQAAGKTVLLTLDIGRSDDAALYWREAWTEGAGDTGPLTAAAPGWLTPHLSADGTARLADPADPGWRETLAGEARALAARGADGLVLTGASAYAALQAAAPDPGGRAAAARATADLVLALAPAAGEGPVLMQGGATLARDAGAPALAGDLAAALSGVIAEGLFAPERDAAALAALRADYGARDLPLLALDRAPADAVDAVHRAAVSAGLLPHVATGAGAIGPALGQPTPGHDVLYAGPAAPRIAGGDGDDRLVALTGPGATLLGGFGADSLRGGPGADRLVGGAGDDRAGGGRGPDRLGGGYGDDRLHGRRGDDSLHGGSGADTLRGGGGDDRLVVGAGPGADRLVGGAGDDRLRAGDGAATLAGGAGDDRLVAPGEAGARVLRGQRGEDSLVGAGGDLRLFGGGGADIVTGGAAGDRLAGGAGGDRLAGRAGADRIAGHAGADSLFGGAGADTLLGQRGPDRLTGDPAGRSAPDMFVFAGAWGRDRVTDFGPGDILRLWTGPGEATDRAAALDALRATPDGLAYDFGADGRNVILLEGLGPGDLDPSALEIL